MKLFVEFFNKNNPLVIIAREDLNIWNSLGLELFVHPNLNNELLNNIISRDIKLQELKKTDLINYKEIKSVGLIIHKIDLTDEQKLLLQQNNISFIMSPNSFCLEFLPKLKYFINPTQLQYCKNNIERIENQSLIE